MTHTLIQADRNSGISRRAEGIGKVSQGFLIAAGGCLGTAGFGCGVAITAGSVRAGEGLDETITGEDRPNAVAAVAGPTAGALADSAIDGVALFQLGSAVWRAPAVQAAASRFLGRTAASETTGTGVSASTAGEESATAGPRVMNNGELTTVRGGAMSRKTALTRLDGMSAQVEKHLAKIARNPTSQAVGHWRTEIKTWLRDMERVVPALGKKTAAEWSSKIDAWRGALGE